MHSILIIEDDTLIARMYQRVFEFDNFDVQTASDGEEGLRKLREKKPTIILLDIMMPKVSGIEVLKKIKADPETKNIPVIVLTNLSGTNDTEQALSLGAVKYIIKSAHKPREILTQIKEIVTAYTRDNIPG